ncbi:MAG: 3-keto-disaccharide hydrolase [Blastocatellia bacterium]
MRISLTLNLIIITALVLSAMAQDKTGNAASNQLTGAEKAAGWRLLFDGETFNGWRGFHNDKVPDGWAIEDGCIKKVPAQGELGRAGGDLITVDQFDNFEFSVEWKLSKGGNSGIKYLISESLPPTGKSGVSFEYQVLDDENHPDAKAGITGNRTAASLYDLIPASNDKQLKPVGEFNQTRIIVKGNHIEHWLNGMKVLEFERGGEKLKQHIAESKFKNTKGFGETAKGHILLQDHGDAVWYRNIKIRTIK